MNKDDQSRKCAAELTQSAACREIIEAEIKRRKNAVFSVKALKSWGRNYVIYEGVSKVGKDSIVGLDLGCEVGRAAKCFFHNKAIKKIYFVENEPDHLEECRSRYNQILIGWGSKNKMYEAGFSSQDYTNQSFHIDEMVDLISCQTGMENAVFESKEKAHTTAENMTSVMKPGGVLVLSILNSEKLLEKLGKSKDKTSFGNDIYKIQFESPEDIMDDFGIKFNLTFDGKKCSKYLVKLPVLEEVLNSHGFDLEMNASYLDLYNQKKVDWEEARRRKKMGLQMLSSEEKETASLYQAVIFRKELK